MECGLKEKTILYFYKELGKEEMESLRKHAASCPACAGELEALRLASAFLDSSPVLSDRLGSSVLAYAREKLVSSPRFSLAEKIYSFAFSFALAMFFLFPFGGSGKPAYNYDMESEISAAEKSLSAMKYDLMETQEYDFEYKASDINYSDMNGEVL